MTVQELIATLQQFPPDRQVIIHDPESNLADVRVTFIQDDYYSPEPIVLVEAW